MEEIIIKPIGIIHTPYKEAKDIPIQGKFRKEIKGTVEVFKEYEQGLKDIQGFSHLILLFYFHKSNKECVIGRPYLEDEEHGIFAIRSPHRPNHIGISIVRLLKRKKNILYIQEIDIFDGTPLLDIKPYVKHFDNRDNIRCGWLEKHFAKNNIPDRTILK
ncbi:MAG: tRNA (N6-threonylcarbamoyladenosine(37)-N6)-methyltransferase TrmO [Candidatus Cloacimonadota bacterium]|nr:MAG: tRNA (N6-threonylcarbamoyladenosine(37)-N6)-methyltransferase TrmO [Candidatus Cloacimonadota bacterium]